MNQRTWIAVLGGVVLPVALVGCASTQQGSAPLDIACADLESCEGAPPRCAKGFFDAYGSTVKLNAEDRARIAQTAQRLEAMGASAWKVQTPQPRYPAQLRMPNRVGIGQVALRFAVKEDGFLLDARAVCISSIEGNAAFARNASVALKQWVVSPEFVAAAGQTPFLAEVNFVFRLKK